MAQAAVSSDALLCLALLPICRRRPSLAAAAHTLQARSCGALAPLQWLRCRAILCNLERRRSCVHQRFVFSKKLTIITGR